jgi:hypothetical protein
VRVELATDIPETDLELTPTARDYVRRRQRARARERILAGVIVRGGVAGSIAIVCALVLMVAQLHGAR